MKPFVKYGLVVAGTGILISLITFIIGIDKTDAGQYIGWLNIPIMIVFMVVAIKETRLKFYNGFISFGQAFRTTAGMVLVSALVTAIFTYMYFTVINPSMVDFIHEKQEMEFIDQGMSDAEVEQALAMSTKFTTPPMMTLFTLLGGLFFGMLVGLIVSAIVKKPDPNQVS